MGIFDRIFKKKEEKKPKEKKPAVVESEEKKKLARKKKSEKPKKEISKRKVIKKEKNIAHRVLIEPFVTEKSTSLGQFNKYVFKINQKFGKRQIKEAIQDYYGVCVTGVSIVKIHPKKRIHGRTVGYKKGYKKAIITLAAGDTIGINENI